MTSFKLLVIVSIVLLIAPLAAFATTSYFDDVPDDDYFVDDINWVKDKGITLGCNAAGTLYCPEEPVLREQMAAFMHRLADSRAVDAGSLSGKTIGSFVYNGAWTAEVVKPLTIPAGGIHTVTEVCPAGKYVVSGGGSATYKQLTMMASHPTSSGVVKKPNAWTVTWVNDSGAGITGPTLSVNAFCAGPGLTPLP